MGLRQTWGWERTRKAKTNTKVDVGNKLQTGEMNDSAGARIVVRQSDGEEKHTKRGKEKVGPSIVCLLPRPGDEGFYMCENRAVLCT